MSRWSPDAWRTKAADLAALYQTDRDLAARQLRLHRHFIEVPGASYDLVSIHPVIFGLSGNAMDASSRSGQNLDAERMSLRAMGYREVTTADPDFDAVWDRYLALCRMAGTTGPSHGPKKPARDRSFFLRHHAAAAELALDPDAPTFATTEVEGGVRQITRDVRERSPPARREAEALARIRQGGRLVCEGCAIDFGHTYGPRGEGFMHFHHLNPLANATGPRPVSGTVDLVPLCPNCHAMVHRGAPMLTIAALRSLLNRG